MSDDQASKRLVTPCFLGAVYKCTYLLTYLFTFKRSGA